jgi:molybdopterin-guanine dinucleotide biosynthesis protein A
VLTGMLTSRAEAVVFLSCDMPFVTASWLEKLVRVQKASGARAVFTQQGKFVGFPFVLSKECLAVVEGQRVKGEFSLQGLAKVLKAERVVVAEKEAWRFVNVNTPEALERAKGRV